MAKEPECMAIWLNNQYKKLSAPFFLNDFLEGYNLTFEFLRIELWQKFHPLKHLGPKPSLQKQ